MKLTKLKLREIIKKQILKEASIEKSYKAIMQLEKVILAAEKVFKNGLEQIIQRYTGRVNGRRIRLRNKFLYSC